MSRSPTARLLRANLRRDRLLLPVWICALAGMVAASGFSIVALYSGEAERVAAGRVIDTSPALVALYGPIGNPHSPGDLGMSKMTVMYALFVMGMALVIVRRHTRIEEETGRAELLGATVVGRADPLRAAVVEAAAATLLLGALAAGLDMAAGLDPVGSVAFGLSWIGCGLVGTGIAAVCCQVSASARTCAGTAVAVIGVLDLLRALGDLGPDALGWLSPLGWNTRLRAWGQVRWWVLLLYAVLAAALIIVAAILRGRRDLGSGLVPARPGPSAGSLGSTTALTWRLNRVSSLWWAVTAVVFGVMFGSIAPHLGSLFESRAGRAALEALGGRGEVAETTLAALLAIMAALLTAYALQVVVVSGHDETDGRTGPVLATGTSRSRVWGGTVLLALVGSAVLAIAYAVGTALGYGTQVGGIGSGLRTLVPAALAHVPAMWVTTAVAVLVWALRPGLVWAGWVILLLFVSLGELGRLLRLPQWALGISPYEHVAKVPVQPVGWTAEAGLLAVAAVVLALSWWCYRRRDIG